MTLKARVKSCSSLMRRAFQVESTARMSDLQLGWLQDHPEQVRRACVEQQEVGGLALPSEMELQEEMWAWGWHILAAAGGRTGAEEPVRGTLMTKRRDAVGLEQGGSYGGRGREKPLGIAAGNHCWNGRGMQISEVILFLCPFTFLCLLFLHLEIGHNVTLPASLGCFVRFGDSERNQHSWHWREDNLPSRLCCHKCNSFELAKLESILHQDRSGGEKHTPHTESQSPQKPIPTEILFYYSQKNGAKIWLGKISKFWCVTERALTCWWRADTASQKYFFIALGPLSIRVPKQLAGWARSQPLNLPEHHLCKSAVQSWFLRSSSGEVGWDGPLSPQQAAMIADGRCPAFPRLGVGWSLS